MYIITLNYFMQPVIKPVVRKISKTYETDDKINRFVPEDMVMGTTETRTEAEKRVDEALVRGGWYDKVIQRMENEVSAMRQERLDEMKRTLRGT